MSKLIAALLLLGALDAFADAEPSVWDRSLEFCAGLSSAAFQEHMPLFQERLREGRKWDADIARVKGELQAMIEVTCPAFLANPNGSTELPKFSATYYGLTKRVLEARAVSAGIVAFLNREYLAARKHYLGAGVAFESFPCAKALDAAKARVTREEKGIESQFQLLKSKCPALAEAQEAAAQSAARGRLAPSPQASAASAGKKGQGGESKREGSTITGFEEEQQKKQK